MSEIANGAYEDETRRTVPIIFLAGPVKFWWTCFGSDEHRSYVLYRDWVRKTLIDANYLTYASWDAIKGTWDKRAQAINDMAISVSDLLIVLTPEGIPADGTEDEAEYAKRLGVPVLYLPPSADQHQLLPRVGYAVGDGVPW